MTIEAVTRQLESIAMLIPYWTPFLLVACIICGPCRKFKWIAPFWVFASLPVFVLFGIIIRAWAIYLTSFGSGPDWGWAGMGMLIYSLFLLFEVIPGALLIYLRPRGPARGSHALFPSIAAAILAAAVSYYVLMHLPTQR